MNQVFTKKKLAAALTLAFATGGAAVLAVAPVPGLVAAAQANQFADTTQTASVSAGINVPATSSVTLTGQTFVITENTGSAIGPVGAVIKLTPTGGAKFKAGTKVNFTGALDFRGKFSSNLTSGDALVADDIDTDGSIQLGILAQSALGAGQSISLTDITMDTSGIATGTDIGVTISSASTAIGLTTGVTTKLGTVTATGATVARASTTVSKIAAGQTLTMDQINISESILGSFGNNATVGADVTIELQGGYTWVSGNLPAMATLSGEDVTNGAGADLDGTVTGVTSTTKAAFQFETTTGTTTAAGVKLTGGKVFVPAGTAAGDVTAVVTVYKSNAVLKSETVVLGSIVTSGTTSTFVEASGTTATVDYSTLFAGRNYATGTAGGVGGEADQLKLAEVVGGSLAQNGSVSLALSNGARFGAAPTKTDTTLALTASTTTFPAATMAYSVTTASTTSGGNTVVTFDNLNLANATAGDLTVSTSGNAGVTAGSVKIAEIVNATTATVGTGAQTITAGSIVTVPEIAILEGKYSALGTSTIGIALPAGYNIQKGSADATDTGTLTNGTHVTVKVYDKNGTDVTASALGSATGTFTTYNGASNTSVNIMTITMAAASSSANGPFTVKVTGLKAKASTTAGAGDINVVIAGADSAGTTTAAALGAEDSTTWSSLAGATKQTVAVGKIVANTVPSIPAATVTGAITSQTITGSVVAAGNDQGKLGTVYVAATLPASAGGGVFLKNSSGTWVAYDPANPAYYASPVTLGTHTLDVVSALDLSTIVGTKVYAGYGLGTVDFGIAAPWNAMLNNGTYNLIYTVQ